MSGADPELLVLGAGPAGTSAALAAAEHGVATILVDSAGSSGGQVYRALPETFTLRPQADPGPDVAAPASGMRWQRAP